MPTDPCHPNQTHQGRALEGMSHNLVQLCSLGPATPLLLGESAWVCAGVPGGCEGL